MLGWRSKLLFILIVYFAGFATAIYTLAPVDEKMISSRSSRSKERTYTSQFNSQEFAKETNVQMRRFLSFAGDKASEVSELIQAKLAEGRSGK